MFHKLDNILHVDTVKCQVNDAKQIHNILKDLSNKLKCTRYQGDLFKQTNDERAKAGQQSASLSKDAVVGAVPVVGAIGERDSATDATKLAGIGPALCLETVDFAAMLINAEKQLKDTESKMHDKDRGVQVRPKTEWQRERAWN